MSSITRRGDKWHVRIRRHGIPSRAASFIRKIDAERWAAEIEGQLATGVYRPQSGRTLQELFAWYRGTILPGRAKSNTDGYRLRTLETSFHGRMGKLTPFQCVEFARARLAAGIASDTIRRDLGLLSDAFNSARAFGFADLDNPVRAALMIIRKQRVLSAPVERQRRLKPGEEAALLRAATGDIRDVIAFALILPLRESEIAAMRREHIDWRASTLSIPRSKTDWKTGEHGRIVPLPPSAAEILRTRAARMDGRVWGYSDPHSIGQAFRRACKRAAIAGLRFHDLRHETTSRLFEAGLSAMGVSVFTGHKSLQMLKRYTHITPQYLLDKLARS